MGDKRLGSLVFSLIGFAATAIELAITPRQFFTSYVYWAGAIVFATNGGFIYGTTKKQSKLPKYGKYSFVLILAIAVGLNGRYPAAITFAFGFAWFFAGLSVKFTYVVLARTRYEYCPNCGKVGWISKKNGRWYCDALGHEVDLAKAREQQKLALSSGFPSSGVAIATPIMRPKAEPVQSGEWLVGGLSNIGLSKGPYRGNYGVYATNKRIFGIFPRPLTARELTQAIPRTVSRELSNLIIQELEAKKDFAITKDEILSIEVKNSPGFLRMGHLLIRSKTGLVVDVGLGKKKLYEPMKELMTAFYPQVATFT